MKSMSHKLRFIPRRVMRRLVFLGTKKNLFKDNLSLFKKLLSGAGYLPIDLLPRYVSSPLPVTYLLTPIYFLPLHANPPYHDTTERLSHAWH